MTDWYMEGAWFKNCNCDPGCPCDFNQNPTKGHCVRHGSSMSTGAHPVGA